MRNERGIPLYIYVLNIDVEKYSFEAEEKQDMTLLSKRQCFKKIYQ